MTNFSRATKLNKTNVDKVPKDKSIVYKFIDMKGDNIYTGIAGRGRVQVRLSQHLTQQRDKITGAVKFKFAQVKDKERAEQIEKQIIRSEKPKFNVRGK